MSGNGSGHQDKSAALEFLRKHPGHEGRRSVTHMKLGAVGIDDTKQLSGVVDHPPDACHFKPCDVEWPSGRPPNACRFRKDCPSDRKVTERKGDR